MFFREWGQRLRHKFAAFGVWDGTVIAIEDTVKEAEANGCLVKWDDDTRSILNQSQYETGEDEEEEDDEKGVEGLSDATTTTTTKTTSSEGVKCLLILLISLALLTHFVFSAPLKSHNETMMAKTRPAIVAQRKIPTTKKAAAAASAAKKKAKAVTAPVKKKKSASKPPASFEPLDFDPFVHSRVAKDFSGTVYNGTVESRECVVSSSGKDLGWHYHVLYDDGDEEDVDERACEAMARLFQVRTGSKNKAGKGAEGKEKRKKVEEKAEKPKKKKLAKKKEEGAGDEEVKVVWPGGSKWVPKLGTCTVHPPPHLLPISSDPSSTTNIL